MSKRETMRLRNTDERDGLSLHLLMDSIATSQKGNTYDTPLRLA